MIFPCLKNRGMSAALAMSPTRLGLKDMLKGSPVLLQQGEAAFSQAAKRTQERVSDPDVDIQPAAVSGLFDRGVDAVACAFVARIGQQRHVVEVGPADAARLLAELNDHIDDRDFKIGSSYLMRTGIHRDAKGFERVWRTQVQDLDRS
jgi:hypothetical protein